MDTREISIEVTQEDYDRDRQKLEELLAKREEIKQQISEARSFGDLSENAEYDAAREAQSRNEAAIRELENVLNNATIVDVIDVTSVSIGNVVEIEDDRGKRRTFTIVGTTQTDSLNNQISNESPAGKAMMGHAVGDRVAFTTPSGRVREYVITNIEVRETRQDDAE